MSKKLKPFITQVLNFLVAIPLAIGLLTGYDALMHYESMSIWQYMFGIGIGIATLDFVMTAVMKDYEPIIKAHIAIARKAIQDKNKNNEV
jgi:hypothetical protein